MNFSEILEIIAKKLEKDIKSDAHSTNIPPEFIRISYTHGHSNESYVGVYVESNRYDKNLVNVTIGKIKIIDNNLIIGYFTPNRMSEEHPKWMFWPFWNVISKENLIMVINYYFPTKKYYEKITKEVLEKL